MKSKKKIGSFSPVGNKIPKCVLIYDDDQEILLLCKIILEKYYHVETRMKCENIISDISQIKPDIILMDLWIPVIGGEKAIALKKNDPATQFVPVILFSANDEIDKICIKTGANGYISKPFDIDTLKEVIERNIS